MLGLEADGVGLPVEPSGVAGDAAVERVAGVDLHARLRRVDLHRSSRRRVAHPRRQRQPIVALGPVDHVVVVDPPGDDDFRRRSVAQRIDDRMRLGIVERRPGDRGQLAGRDLPLVGGGVAAGVDEQYVLLDGAAALACQVEVAVVGEVVDGRRVGRDRVVEPQGVVGRQAVFDGGGQRAGEAFLAVRADAGEADADGVALVDRLGLPVVVIEAAVAAVEGELALVGRHLDGAAVELEAATGDAIAVAADDGAEVRVLCEVALDVAEAEDDVGGGAVAAGDMELLDDRAPGEDGGGNGAVGELVAGDRAVVVVGGGGLADGRGHRVVAPLGGADRRCRHCDMRTVTGTLETLLVGPPLRGLARSRPEDEPAIEACVW